MGSLTTSLITILQRLRQSSGSFYAGELVSHPQRGVLKLFTHTQRCLKSFDKQEHLFTRQITVTVHFCTCISKWNPTDLLDTVLFLVLTPTPPASWHTHAHTQCFLLALCLSLNACEYECARVPERRYSRCYSQMYLNSMSHDLILSLPFPPSFCYCFLSAVQYHLLWLLSKNHLKDEERKLRSKWWCHPAFFSVQMFQHFL